MTTADRASPFTRTELQQWRRRIEGAASDSERARLLKQLDNRLKVLAAKSTD